MQEAVFDTSLQDKIPNTPSTKEKADEHFDSQQWAFPTHLEEQARQTTVLMSNFFLKDTKHGKNQLHQFATQLAVRQQTPLPISRMDCVLKRKKVTTL